MTSTANIKIVILGFFTPTIIYILTNNSHTLTTLAVNITLFGRLRTTVLMYVDGILGQTKGSVNRITRCWITCLNLNMNIFTTSYIEHVRSSTRDEDLVRLVKRIDGRSSTEEKELCMLPYINSYERFQELSNILKRSAKQQYLSSNNLRRFRKLYIYILCALNM